MAQKDFKNIPTEDEVEIMKHPGKYGSKGKNKKKVGRPVGTKKPVYKPEQEDRDYVKMMSVNAIPQAEQAEILGISVTVFQKNFSKEIKHGKRQATSKVSGALYKSAVGGNVSAQIFWLKSQGGWREADRLELTGANGKQLVNLTETEKEQRLLAALLRAKKIDPTMPTGAVDMQEGPDNTYTKDT